MGISQPRLIYPTPTSLPRSQKSRKVSLPPPVGGWNTRDDPVRMEPTDATDLVNFFPEINQVSVRGGYIEHATLESNTGIKADGTNYLDGGDIAAFDFGASQDFTVECWFALDGSEAASKSMLAKSNGTTGWSMDWTFGSKGIFLFIGDGTNFVTAISDAAFTDTAYHHIAFTVDRTGDEINIYVDVAAPAEVAL